MERKSVLTSVSVSMGLLLLGIYIGRRSVIERDVNKRVLIPGERRKKRTEADIVRRKEKVDDNTNDNYLGDLIVSGRSITAGLVRIAKRIIRRGVMSISIGDSTKTIRITSVSDFLMEFNKKAITVYMTNIQAMSRLPKNEKEMYGFLSKYGLEKKFNKMLERNLSQQ